MPPVSMEVKANLVEDYLQKRRERRNFEQLNHQKRDRASGPRLELYTQTRGVYRPIDDSSRKDQEAVLK
jgi:hypothetical protein